MDGLTSRPATTGSTLATADSAREATRPHLSDLLLGHASLAMTMREAHPRPEHLRREMAKTERSDAEEPGTGVGQRGQDASEVVKFTDERRGSSVAEQLIRNQ